jgi:hypothetical protein
MKNKRLIPLVIITMLSLGACNEEGTKESGMSLIKTTNPTPISLEKNTKKETDLIRSIEKDIEGFKEIYDVSIVKGKKDILVSYKVKHLQRFRMKKIEERMNKLLEKKYPDENFTVSSDYKIFLESIELQEKMKDPNFSDKKAEDKLQEIIKLKEEKT